MAPRSLAVRGQRLQIGVLNSDSRLSDQTCSGLTGRTSVLPKSVNTQNCFLLTRMLLRHRRAIGDRNDISVRRRRCNEYRVRMNARRAVLNRPSAVCCGLQETQRLARTAAEAFPNGPENRMRVRWDDFCVSQPRCSQADRQSSRRLIEWGRVLSPATQAS